MRILVTGTKGQVARSLCERATIHGVDVVVVGRPEIDLTQSRSVADVLEAHAPDVIVNAAAYTAVDQAEAEPDVAQAVNGRGAGAVAAAATALHVPLVHLSTDYVFDGLLKRPYRETDPVGPMTAYGRSKLYGEHAVAAATENHAILRTAWVYSPFGNNFLKTMLHIAETRDEVSVVADQHGSPTSALDIADAVIAVARNLASRPQDQNLRGVFHMAGRGYTTWAAFAARVFDESARRGGPTARVRHIETSSYPTRARRPANSRLDCSKLSTIHGVQLPEWEASVKECIARLIPTNAASGEGY